MKASAWLHCSLAAYLWMVEAVPLGNWNRQRGERLLPALLNGSRVDTGDFFALLFAALPAILFCVAYKQRRVPFAAVALGLDVVWFWMQIQSWWVPYIFGTGIRWQIEYAKGPTTKVLPSFGNHVAPDGMHLVIHILLAAAFLTGVFGIRQLWQGEPRVVPCRPI